MGNGALPNGPSYRAHPQLYHSCADQMHGISGVGESGHRRECPTTPGKAPAAGSRLLIAVHLPSGQPGKLIATCLLFAFKFTSVVLRCAGYGLD